MVAEAVENKRQRRWGNTRGAHGVEENMRLADESVSGLRRRRAAAAFWQRGEMSVAGRDWLTVMVGTLVRLLTLP